MDKTKKILLLTSLSITALPLITISCNNEKDNKTTEYEKKYIDIKSELAKNKYKKDIFQKPVEKLNKFLNGITQKQLDKNDPQEIKLLDIKYKEFLKEIEKIIQDQKNQAKKALEDYINELEVKLQTSELRDDQKTDLTKALNTAKNVLNDQSSTKENFELAKNTLQNSYEAILAKPDPQIELKNQAKKALEDYISELEVKLQTSELRDDQKKDLTKALNTAKNVLNDQSSTKENFEWAKNTLQNSYEAILAKPDPQIKLKNQAKKALEDYISELEVKLQTSELRDDQKTDLTSALNTAKNVLNDQSSTKENFELAKNTLQNSYEAILAKPDPNTPQQENSIKWGHWNVLNFTGDDSKQADKTKRIALLAFLEKFDVLGLTEVDRSEGVQKLVDLLNLYGASNKYSFVVSQKLKGDKFKANSAEHVAIIYNKLKVTPVPFDNGNIGYSYTQTFADDFGDSAAQYARPPYGVKFKYNLKPEKKMTFVFAHFDGPGVKKSAGEESYKGMGSFEYRESKQLVNVLDYFDSIDGIQSNIYFGGDTNIKLGKQSTAFAAMKNKYISLFEDKEENKTSLGREKLWSQPYDKMFVKSEFTNQNHFIFNIYKTKTDQRIIDLFTQYNVALSQNDKIWTASVLSDHTYIGSEIIIN
ncbi:hypothetical protein DMC14_000880 [Metamycoplasma phocicerebrale]|uniref:Endonuclease/exonuclease/phosphatase domain-containing protein n=1 Tax=Metamycoplasma phocicerebrale TaxID=142649 RepID=A0A3Q9V2W0_9BACT|nr:variable surface lipoprotein [Metamycoplasma phocicerebrale]AZZ65347.1 hypothetical protein DMC14_000880 [Metamycoplasma phocicerebrale]